MCCESTCCRRGMRDGGGPGGGGGGGLILGGGGGIISGGRGDSGLSDPKTGAVNSTGIKNARMAWRLGVGVVWYR